MKKLNKFSEQKFFQHQIAIRYKAEFQARGNNELVRDK